MTDEYSGPECEQEAAAHANGKWVHVKEAMEAEIAKLTKPKPGDKRQVEGVRMKLCNNAALESMITMATYNSDAEARAALDTCIRQAMLRENLQRLNDKEGNPDSDAELRPQLTLKVFDAMNKLPKESRKIDTAIFKQVMADASEDSGMSRFDTGKKDYDWFMQKVIKPCIDQADRQRSKTIDALAALMREKYVMHVTDDNAELLIWHKTHFEGAAAERSQDLIVKSTLEDYEQGMTSAMVSEVLEKIKRTGRLLIPRRALDTKRGIAFSNGWLDFETCQLQDNEPENLNRIHVDCMYEDVDMPELDGNAEYTIQDIEQAMQGTEYIRALMACFTVNGKLDFAGLYTVLESFAYALSTDTQMQKAIMHIGRGNNGKSVFLDHIKEVIGNSSNESIHDLAENKFRLANLEGKLLNVYTDIEYHDLDKGSSKLKILIDGDSQSAERKQQHSFSFSNFATLMFSANTFPQAMDQTDGWFRRFLIVDWQRQFTKDEIIPDLKEQLIADGMANGRLMGLLVKLRKRLYERGRFRFDPGTARTRTLWNSNANPIEAFQNMHVRKVADYNTVPMKELHTVYQEFCADRGIAALSIRTFNRHIRENYTEQTTTVDNESTKVWQGMELIKPEQTTLKDADENDQ